jgi:hypothetical protein
MNYNPTLRVSAKEKEEMEEKEVEVVMAEEVVVDEVC